MKSVSWNFPGCFKKVLSVFTENFKGVLMKFKGCFKGVSGKFQARKFQGSFKGVQEFEWHQRKFLRRFQGHLEDV